MLTGGRAPADLADELKTEAERQLYVDPQLSLEIAERICGLADDPGVRALGLMARADALRYLGRRSEAVEAYEASANLFRSIGDEIGWARTRIGATSVARYTGAYSQILGELDDARRILAEHQLWLRLARLENSTGMLLSGLGRNQEAHAAYQRALSAAEQVQPFDDRLEAEVLGNLSLACYETDDFDQAEALHGRMLEIFQREGQYERIARAQRNYARFAAGRGHYSKALAAVLPGRRDLLAVGRTDAAAHLGQVGVDCFIRLNRPREAAELAATVVAEFDSIGASIEAATTRGMRAIALARVGEADAALSELAKADTVFGETNWESGPAAVRLGRAVVLGEHGQWREALAEADAVSSELRLRGLVGRAVQAELVRARALRALGDPQSAAAAARSALELAPRGALPWLGYHGWRLLGELARDQGDGDGALDAFMKAITSLETVQGQILTEYRASFLADKADVYEPAVELLLDRGEVDRAFELVERAKSRALVDALAGGLDIRVRPTTPRQAELADEVERLRREHCALLEEGDTSPRRSDLENDIYHVLEELRLAGANDLERLSLLQGQVYSPQPHLGPGTALVEFFAIRFDLVAFVMDGQRLRAQRIPDALPEIGRLLRALQLNFAAAASAPAQRRALEPNARALLGHLYDRVLGPVATWLEDYKRLVIVPHGLLHQLPFAALHDGRGHLLERFEIALAPSASSLTFCLRPRSRDGSRVLVLANTAEGALPEVAEEADIVAAIYGSEALLEERATVTELKRRASDADVIHIAAHGVSRLDAPVFSYLRLAGGHLTALDCFELELDCALVTLSACESGPGLVAAGDEQIGLPRAFLYAGARSVAHTLWRVDDRATRALMERFYRELRAGRGRAAALCAAQIDALRSQGVHPFLWAALTLTGDWR